LSLAPTNDLPAVLGVMPGVLSPLALINDEDEAVSLLLEADIKDLEQYVFHPLDNAMSVQMTPSGLAKFLSKTGHRMTWVSVAARSVIPVSPM
jgi:Ala-tRNA(Pro) deacylase